LRGCLLLLLNQLGVLLHGVLFQILQVLLYVDRLPVQLVEDLNKLVVGLRELGINLSDQGFVSAELLLNKQDELVEVWFVHDEPQDDGLVDVDRGEFVAVALIDHLG
jgi:hypothetical protein